ncbi:homoaconitate hydratase family protein [Sneathiella chungangensis]|uniref:Homoaconitate hydratase family protein n=1 Tax=Sneathiella chungangensis TaxID=1418234 RepID=A0A845MJM0_9PROT|nr:aconitase/3-isopropylmalate dehydratase large subunit family protein [Sneathiella chungangensis]MZR23885.1 homoaconitate hydratase family protein [Sneathiella chungangensis]
MNTHSPQTIAQKVFARTAGKEFSNIGELLMCEPDLFQAIDLTLPHYLQTIKERGIYKLRNPEKIIVFADHEVPAQSERVAALKRDLRLQLKELGISHFYDEGRHGISHQAIVENGHVLPGMLVTGNDTHITTLGAVGALATPIVYEALQAFVTGEMWFRVPETIRINYSGTLNEGVMSRDISQWLISKLGRDRVDYRVLEFGGTATASIDMDFRMTICNVAVDIGAKAALFEPDSVTRDYLAARVKGEYEIVSSDAGASYSEVFNEDLSDFEPMIALPPRPENVDKVSAAAGVKVDQVYIGSCAGGRMEDLRAAARILEGRTVREGVRMVVVPTSQQIYSAAAKEGLLSIFVDAGAMVTAPSCGPCYGSLAPLADGEVCIGTGTTNIPGRMGSQKADIYLSNAMTASAAAIAGEIVDPRNYL